MRRGFLITPKPAKPRHVQPDTLVILQKVVAPPPTAQDTLDIATKTNFDQDEINHFLQSATVWLQNQQPVFHNIIFEHFQGAILLDTTVLPLLPEPFTTPAWAPDGLYRIEPVEGKGIGMIAARDIAADALILVENPVLVYFHMLAKRDTRTPIMRNLFARLDRPERARVLALKNCKPSDMCCREEGILRTNCMGITLPVPDIEHPPDATHNAIFLDLSRCNHSCNPNAEPHWDLTTFSMSLLAVRPIMPGEEITISYINLHKSREARQRHLQQAYYFNCECEVCVLGDDDDAVAEQ